MRPLEAVTNRAERSPAECAAGASSAIRALNRLTVDPRACSLDDVYAVLGSLREMTARLEQSIVQLAGVLELRLIEGGLRTDASCGDTPGTVVGASRDDLVAAGSLAGRLETEISDAHRRVGTLADTPTPDGSSGRPPGRAIRRPTGNPSRPGPSRSM
jgi:hypothetical protein